MRHGKLVADRPVSEVTQEDLFQLMVGKASAAPQRAVDRNFADSAPALEFKDVSRKGAFRNVSLTVHPGQCVAIVGTLGSGREELCRAAFGAETYDSGEILFGGEEIGRWSMREAVRKGMAYVPAERKVEGMVGGLPASENLILANPGAAASGPILRPGKRKAMAAEWFETLDVRPNAPELKLERFSGGNQQKVVMAKWLKSDNLQVLVLDHPLRGLDMGAAQTVNAQIREACARGVGVLLIADTLEEALESAHVVVVMRDGEVTASYDLSVDTTNTLELLERMV